MVRAKASVFASLLLLLTGCSDPAPAPPATSASGSAAKASASAPAQPASAPATTSAAVPSSSAAAPADGPAAVLPEEGPPVCTRSNEKVHSEDALAVTGLTTKGFKTDLAVGFAGNGIPRVLVIDGKGGTKVMDVQLGEKSHLSKEKGTWRNLMRVSPRDIAGEKARAFIDYYDASKDKKRHVWCGPADANETFLEWEGTSWLDLDPKPAAGTEEKKALFSWKKLGGYIELRDCRSFVTLEKDEAWALGSMLRGVEKEDGTNEWKTILVVDYGKGDEEVVLYEIPLKGDPPKFGAFEIPTMRRAGDKGFVVAARLGGSLWVATLDKDRKVKGSPKFYPGWPTGTDIATTKDALILTTGVGLGKEKTLKGLVIPRDTLALPDKLTDIGVKPYDASGDEKAQFVAPELTLDSKGQLWLAYVEGPKDKGHIRIAPVGPDLQPVGRSFPITAGDASGVEARLHALADGKLVVAYLRTKDKKTQLVTEELSCDIQK